MKAQFPSPSRTSAIGNPTIGFIDLSVTRINTDARGAATVILGTEEPPISASYNIKGDWLHVPADSNLCFRADLFGNSADDVRTILLTPGLTVEMPFTSIRVYNNCQSIVAGRLLPSPAGSGGNPVAVEAICRVLYGNGKAPVQSVGPHAGFILTPGSQTQNTTQLWDFYNLPEGTQFDVTVQVSHTTDAVVAQTSRLIPQMIYFNSTAVGQFGSVAPDNVDRLDVPTAVTSATASLQACWRGLVIPRGCSRIRVGAIEAGSANSNSLQPLGGFSVGTTVILR